MAAPLAVPDSAVPPAETARQPHRLAAVALRLPPAVYLVVAVLLILQRPGLQYEEAMFQHGAVHLLTSPRERPPFQHDEGSWVSVGGRYWPLMIVPYVGATPFYVFVAPKALFGPSIVIPRLVMALLGALGLFGLVRLLRDGVGPTAALCVGLVLAIHPSYVVHTAFNKASVAFWMGCLGLCCLALRAYLRRPSRASALALGLAGGFACWVWLQFAWLLLAAVVAAAVVAGRRLLVPVPHFLSAAAGAVVGGAPLLLYQLTSGGSTFRRLSFFRADDPMMGRIASRLRILAETLVCDREQRTLMWHGPEVPAPYAWLVLGLVLAGALTAALRLRGDAERTWHCAAAVCWAALTSGLLLSNLRFAPHHFVVLLPLAAAVVVLAGQRLLQRFALRAAAWSMAVAYACSALAWDAAIGLRLHQTGGRRDWSDGILALSRRLAARPEGRRVKVLDWGLANNLYVVSQGAIRPQELFWLATRERSVRGRPWAEEIVPGGVYVTMAEPNLHFPQATEGFLDALARSGVAYQRSQVRGRDGYPFAEVYEIAP